MNSYSLISVIRAMPVNEKRLFRKFLKSPYFTANEDQIKLFDLIVKHKKMTELTKRKKMIFYPLIYAGKKYTDSKIRFLYSKLNKSYKEFLIQENIRNKPFEKTNYLLSSLLYRNISGQYELNEFENNSKFKTGADYLYFLNMHFLESHRFNIHFTSGRLLRSSDISSGLDILEKSAKHLFLFYFSQICLYYNTSLILKHRYSLDKEPMLINFLAAETAFKNIYDVMNKIDEYHFITELYFNLITMNKNPEENSYYYKYKNTVNKYASRLSPDERSVHISNLFSYCSGRATRGIDEFNDELFNLIELIINNEYYKDSKTSHLGYDYFRNFFLHGLRLKKYGWVKEFIMKNYKKVNPLERDNMKNLGLAHLSFNRGKFSEALDYINKINIDQFIYKFEARNLTVRIFYELGYTEEALSQIKSYKEYLRKDRLLNPETRKRYINFLKVLEKLVLSKAGSENIDLGYIKHRLETNSNLSFKPWLLEKILQINPAYKKTG